MARRLSEVYGWKVLVLEAGEFGNDLTSITGMAYKVVAMSDYNWGYYSVPQKYGCLGKYIVIIIIYRVSQIKLYT